MKAFAVEVQVGADKRAAGDRGDDPVADDLAVAQALKYAEELRMLHATARGIPRHVVAAHRERCAGTQFEPAVVEALLALGRVRSAA